MWTDLKKKKGYSPLGKGNFLNDPAVVQIASKYGKSPAQVAIKWSIMVMMSVFDIFSSKYQNNYFRFFVLFVKE